MSDDAFTTLQDEDEMTIVYEQVLKNVLITQGKPPGVYLFADHELIKPVDFAFELYQQNELIRFKQSMKELQDLAQSMRLDVEINIYVLTDDQQFYYFDDV